MGLSNEQERCPFEVCFWAIMFHLWLNVCGFCFFNDGIYINSVSIVTEFTDSGLWLLTATQKKQQRQCHSTHKAEQRAEAQSTTPYRVHK